MNSLPTKSDFKVDFLPFINYESIVCTVVDNPSQTDPTSHRSQTINAACMGVHFTSSNEVFLHVIENTHTHELLKDGTVFAINFSENFEEYVIAGLKEFGPEEFVDELPLASFESIKPAPILKSSWCTVICEVIPMPTEFLQKPPCRRRQEPNVRAKILENRVLRLPQVFNNRSMNLALEALILASRIPNFDLYSNEAQEMLSQYIDVKKKINSWRDMDRFENSFLRMDNYLIKNGIKPQSLFDI